MPDEEPQSLIYIMPSEAAGFEVLDALAERFPTKRDEHPAESLIYHDTFDWRLYRNGDVVTSRPSPRGRLLEWRRQSGALRHRLEVDTVPAFAWDFPAGPIRDDLEPITSIRCLLPVVEIERRRRTVHVLDDEQKTVARVVFHEGQAREGGREASAPRPLTPMPITLAAVALRGYDREFRELVDCLERAIGLERSAQDELTTAMSAIGRRPGDYSSKPRIELDGDESCEVAMVRILRHLFETLQTNEAGTRCDLDSEFLHDFRVSVRRTRSALTQLKKVLPSQVTGHFRTEFSWLGKVTGPTRDLDVYRLKIGDYEAALPAAIRPDLEPLREFLKRHQRIEQQRLVRELDSERYQDLKRAWGQFLAEPVGSSAPSARRPIRDLASERIWKAWRRVWKRGRIIGPRTPAQALHDLRIDCKKLRYLLEFFRSLYEASEMDVLIKALKGLQDNLGDFNDLEVQQGKLREFAVRMQDEGVATGPALLAMGELVSDLRRRQDAERQDFAERFARFTEPRHRESFRRLFAPAAKAG